MKIKIGIADDHQLFLKSLATLINDFIDCDVVIEALNGKDLLTKISSFPVLPDILLIDVEMPVMNGAEAAKIIAATYPSVKMIALSMKDDELSVLNMLRSGCCSYLLKDIHPDSLESALQEVYSRGYYNTEITNLNYRKLASTSVVNKGLKLSERELEFLQLATSDLTYKEIAAIMFLAERTIDGYRESLFEKLNVKSRVGMVLEGLRRELVSFKKNQS